MSQDTLAHVSQLQERIQKIGQEMRIDGWMRKEIRSVHFWQEKKISYKMLHGSGSVELGAIL